MPRYVYLYPTVSCLLAFLIAASSHSSVIGLSDKSVRRRLVSFVNNNEHHIRQQVRPRHSSIENSALVFRWNVLGQQSPVGQSTITKREARRDEPSGDACNDDGIPSNDRDDEEKDVSQKFTLAEIAQKEEAASRRVMNRLLLPDKIGKVINFAAWFFVISSIALESLGYGYVPREGGGLTIDTLENKAFVMEMRRDIHHH
jgi:hypothetical protein